MKYNLKKAILCFVLTLALSITTISPLFAVADEAGSSDDGVMRDGLTATQVSEEMGIGLNLGNTMEAYWLDDNIRKSDWLENGRIDSGAQTIGGNTPYDYETCWGAVYTTEQAIAGMKAAGFSTVRIPVYWGNMMVDDGTFTINSEYIARVKEIVDYCRDNDMYVVINIHHYDEFLIRRYAEAGTLEECADTMKVLWTQIAEYFKDYSDYLVFEGFNEYLGGGPYERGADGNVLTDEWGNPKVINFSAAEAYEWTNTLNQAFVDAVRATGGNNADRILIVSGYWTNIDNTTSSSFKMPTDTVENKLMVSVHYVDNAMFWTNKIGSTEWQNYSIDQCEKLKSAFTDKGIPVFVGECTASYSSDRFSGDLTERDSSKTLDYMLRLITSYGFTPVIWDTSNNFYSRTNAKIQSETDAEVIRILATEMGVEIPENDATEENGTEDNTEITGEAEKNPVKNPDKTTGNTSQNTDTDTESSFKISIVGVVVVVVLLVGIVGVFVVKRK